MSITCPVPVFLNAQNIFVSNHVATFNGTAVKLRSKAKKHRNPPSEVNIEQAMTTSFQVFCFQTCLEKIENRQFLRN